MNKVIKFLFYSLIFFTPLLMASFTSELFEFNKMIFIYMITVLISFFWILKMILSRKIILKKTVLDIPIYLFLASQLFSTLFSIDIHTSLFSYYGRFNGGLLSTITYIILFYAFVSNLMTGQNLSLLKKILNISLISSTLVILWGLPGRFGHDLSCLLFMGQFNNGCWTDQFRPSERMFSTLGQPNWLGAYLAINFFIGLYFFLREINYGVYTDWKESVQNNKKIIIYGSYLFINFVSILFTRSRSALGAVIFALLILFAYLVYLNKFDFKKTIGNKLGLLLISFLLSILIFKTGIQKIDQFYSLSYYKNLIFKSSSTVQTPVKQNPTAVPVQNIEGVTPSSDIRMIVWKGAIDLGLRYPLFGTGVETFAYSYYFVRPKEHNLTSEWDFLYNKAHNEFLNYLATTGFIGLGTYLIFIGSFLWFSLSQLKSSHSAFRALRDNQNLSKNNESLLIICLVLSYLTILITNFFGFSTTTVNIYFFLIPGFIIFLNAKDDLNQKSSYSGKLTINRWVLSLVFAAITFLLLIYLTRYYLADINFAKGDNYSKTGEYQNAVQYLENAYNLKYEHVYEDSLSYTIANLAFIASYQKQKDLAKKMISISDALNKKSISASPKNVLYWKTRAKNYYLFYQISLNKNDLESGVQALKDAEKLSPTDPKISYSLSVFYSLLDDAVQNLHDKQQFEQLAINEINKSISLKSDYRDGYFLKGQLLKKFGRRDEAKNTFQIILKKLNPNDEEVKKELTTL